MDVFMTSVGRVEMVMYQHSNTDNGHGKWRLEFPRTWLVMLASPTRTGFRGERSPDVPENNI